MIKKLITYSSLSILKKMSDPTFLDVLPKDILEQILLCLPYTDIVHTCQASVKTKKVVYNQTKGSDASFVWKFWERKFKCELWEGADFIDKRVYMIAYDHFYKMLAYNEPDVYDFDECLAHTIRTMFRHLMDVTSKKVFAEGDAEQFYIDYYHSINQLLTDGKRKRNTGIAVIERRIEANSHINLELIKMEPLDSRSVALEKILHTMDAKEAMQLLDMKPLFFCANSLRDVFLIKNDELTFKLLDHLKNNHPDVLSDFMEDLCRFSHDCFKYMLDIFMRDPSFDITQLNTEMSWIHLKNTAYLFEHGYDPAKYPDVNRIFLRIAQKSEKEQVECLKCFSKYGLIPTKIDSYDVSFIFSVMAVFPDVDFKKDLENKIAALNRAKEKDERDKKKTKQRTGWPSTFIKQQEKKRIRLLQYMLTKYGVDYDSCKKTDSETETPGVSSKVVTRTKVIPAKAIKQKLVEPKMVEPKMVAPKMVAPKMAEVKKLEAKKVEVTKVETKKTEVTKVATSKRVDAKKTEVTKVVTSKRVEAKEADVEVVPERKITSDESVSERTSPTKSGCTYVLKTGVNFGQKCKRHAKEGSKHCWQHCKDV